MTYWSNPVKFCNPLGPEQKLNDSGSISPKGKFSDLGSKSLKRKDSGSVSPEQNYCDSEYQCIGPQKIRT